jgi:DNA-binding transcriptional MerR regulator
MELNLKKEPIYSIGDVSRICNIPGYTIRFWEKEFSDYILAERTKGKQRRYNEEHIKKILKIKKLLWEDGFSIRGAKRILKYENNSNIKDIPLDSSKNCNISEIDMLAIKIADIIKKQLPLDQELFTTQKQSKIA